ncbi:MAG: hypothetical protein EP301_05205, partial [Gammaproteobacteria bacterium]
MERLVRALFLLSVSLMPVSCWQRDDFVADLAILPELGQEPVQDTLVVEAFEVHLNDVVYQVEPKYAYDLHGLVVSYQHHDGERMLHRRWNDHLNVADLCVVWGANASQLDLNEFEFWNGQFTCFVKTGDRAAWRAFDETGLSNNHLLTEDPYLRQMIEKVRIGDQIRIRGWLAGYRNQHGFSRGTSTTRTDRGNGACETIYVRDFQILSSMN